MTNIKLRITGATARVEVEGPLTSGMVGIPITIEYDDAWDGLTKNLVCQSKQWSWSDGEIRTLLNVENYATVAHEVMIADYYLYLGIEGYNSDGTLVIPTKWAECGIILPGAHSGADLSADPTLPIYEQLQQQINTLKEKETGNESSACTNQNAHRLKGHSWSVLGDSISHDNLYVSTQYWDYLNARVGGMTIYNYGNSGDRITNMATRYTQMNYSDIITVFGGVNDWGRSEPIPIGTLADSDTTTFYGALNILCHGLQTVFPESLIVFVTPLGNNGFYGFPTDENSLGLTVYDYAEAIKNVCAKYKIPVVDACSESLLNPQIENIKNTYFYDGLHLNERGHEVLSYLLEHELLRHYIPTVTSDSPADIPATSVTLSATTLTFANSTAQTLTAAIVPSNSTDTVVWSSSDESVVTVENGVVTPVLAGTAIITAKAGIVTASCVVTVGNGAVESSYAYNGETVSITGASYPTSHALFTIPVAIDEMVAAGTEIMAVLKYSSPNKVLEPYSKITVFEAEDGTGSITQGDNRIASITNLVIEDNTFTMSGTTSKNQAQPVLLFPFPFAISSAAELPISFTIDEVFIFIGGKDYSDKAQLPCGLFAGDVVAIENAEDEEAVVNQITISTDEDGSIYNGTGWKSNMRLSNSNGAAASYEETNLTGFIPLGYNDVLYGSADIFAEVHASYSTVTAYDATKTLIAHSYINDNPATIVFDDTGKWTFTPSADSALSEIAFVRVCGIGISDASVITVNEPIA